MTEIVSFTIKKEIKEYIDRQRGDVPRSRIINRLLEDFVENDRNRIEEKLLTDIISEYASNLNAPRPDNGIHKK